MNYLENHRVFQKFTPYQSYHFSYTHVYCRRAINIVYYVYKFKVAARIRLLFVRNKRTLLRKQTDETDQNDKRKPTICHTHKHTQTHTHTHIHTHTYISNNTRINYCYYQPSTTQLHHVSHPYKWRTQRLASVHEELTRFHYNLTRYILLDDGRFHNGLDFGKKYKKKDFSEIQRSLQCLEL